MRRLLPLSLFLLIPIVLSACGGGGGPSTASQDVPVAGGTIALGKDVTLHIPPGALAAPAKVTITKKNAPDGALPGGQSLGSGYNIDLGGQKLAKLVTLEISYDPNKFPKYSSAEQAFLSYYDEAKKTWVPVGGTVDTQRNVITIQTDHLSWWNPFTWNWGAWIAVLNDLLTGNVTDFLHAVNLLTTSCAQTGSTVSVDASKANNVIQGCVEKDDPSSPQLRVVNPKSFFYEVKPISGGNGYPPETMLGPGDDLTFQASTSDPAPLVVQAEITQKAGLYLVVHLIIQMLPGLNELGIQGPQIACITEKLSDVSYFVSASEALLVSHDGAAAAEQLVHFLADGDAVQRFITATADCNYGAAPTWSLEGIKQIGTATATIISATDFIANYLLNTQSQISFVWTPTAKVVTFDEMATLVSKAWAQAQASGVHISVSSTSGVIGLCDLSQGGDRLTSWVRHAKEGHELYKDINYADAQNYGSAVGALTREVQKIADSTKYDVFTKLETQLETDIDAYYRQVVNKKGGSEQDVQNAMSIWRSNFLVRDVSHGYNAMYCDLWYSDELLP